MVRVIEGNILAERIKARWADKKPPEKYLAACLVGNNPASLSFVRQKEKAARAWGIPFEVKRFADTIGEAQLLEAVRSLNGDTGCGGMIIQLPLPSHINRKIILDEMLPEKDVDLLGANAFEAFRQGEGKLLPPSAGVVEEILKDTRTDVSLARVAVVGRGLLVGLPVATYVSRRAKEVQILRRGSDLKILHDADLVISGVGSAEIIAPGLLKDGAGVIDFGYEDGKGDLNIFGGGLERLSFYTPTPGGTGPILVAKVLENFRELNNSGSL